jgi:phosphatidylinositol-3-phosphatase
MRQLKWSRMAGASVFSFALLATSAAAQQIKTVFVIALENHNWTQPTNQPTGKLQQLYKNPNAPFINSLVDGSAETVINGANTKISQEVAYATAYHNVLATADGNNPHIHPSEPNYIWSEAGTNFGVASDNDPYSPKGPTIQDTTDHLSSLLTKAGKTWKSYQEDIDLAPNDGGLLTNVALPQNQWTVPLVSFSGMFAPRFKNAYNGSERYNYAVKHDPMAFFTDTNGDDITTVSNPLAGHYAPLQQLFTDLKNNTVANYNWITPDLYNDMHSSLEGGYQGLTGDAANIKQGDDFLSQIVPLIMASKAYQDGGAIIIWCDESERDGDLGDNPDRYDHAIPEIVISPRAHANVNGVPYASALNYTHSSDLRTMQEIFHLGAPLGDAANVPDLSDLFAPGAIPKP